VRGFPVCLDGNIGSVVPFLVDLSVAFAAALLAFLVARRYLASPLPDDPVLEGAEKLGEAILWSRFRRLAAGRLDRSAATGLLLTSALALVAAGGVVLGVLAYLVRRSAAVQHFDNAVAGWGFRQQGSFSTDALKAVTQLGNIQVAIALAVLLALLDVAGRRGGWTPLFLAVVLGGTEAISNGVKHLVDRARPRLTPPPPRSGRRSPAATRPRLRRSMPPPQSCSVVGSGALGQCSRQGRSASRWRSP
jgi:hypothetical protein